MTGSHSRTTNTIYNFASSIGGLLINVILQFIVRTVFISTLGKSYLGIEGLFSNILSMLSLAELGMGSAILYKLYAPLAGNDISRIRVLMRFYKNAYRVIGCVVIVCGLCLIPFLPSLISDHDKLDALGLNTVLIFCLYLARSASSYFFLAYRSSVIKADQREYIVNLISYIFTISAAVLEIIFLLIFKSFEIYVIAGIFTIAGQNICCGLVAKRLYPAAFAATDERLQRGEIKGIFKDCGALFLNRMNSVVMKATDNIILSAFMGLDTVALYSNYYIFYTTIFSLFGKVYTAVSHSLGNLHVTDNSEHEYRVYETVMLISAMFGGTAFAGIFVCADGFVSAWLGAQWVIAQPFALLMGLELYTMAFRSALSHYRSSMGLFRQSWFRPLVGMAVNIILSLILVNVWGICGVLVGTLAADWLAFMWIDPFIVHKYGFGGRYRIGRYYLKFIKNFAICICMAAADKLLCSYLLAGDGWLFVLLHALICLITVPGILALTNIKSTEFKYLKEMIVNIIKRRSVNKKN